MSCECHTHAHYSGGSPDTQYTPVPQSGCRWEQWPANSSILRGNDTPL